MSDEIRDVIIVGSGPAGYTAAVYTARANLRPLLVEGVQYGGALMNTTEVENFPGFVDGIQGPDLMDHMRKQAERFGAEIISDDATELSLTGEVKTVVVGGETYRARTVILAMGSAYRMLGLPNEDRLMGHGVSACATCGGFFFRGQVGLDVEGYVLVGAPSTRTNLDGVFACGDLVDHIFRQAITAAGTGCQAALDAERWLAQFE